jgi:hypothetical protein
VTHALTTIDVGVPIPRKRLALDRYPFASMELNESFALPDDGRQLMKDGRLINAAAHKLRNSVSRWTATNRSRRRFAIRCVLERGARVVRCWRVK